MPNSCLNFYPLALAACHLTDVRHVIHISKSFLAPALRSVGRENIAADRDSIYFMAGSDRLQTIKASGLAMGHRRDMAVIDASSSGGLSVSPDETTLVFGKLEETESDLVVMSLQ